MRGLYAHEVFDRITGSSHTKGVILDVSPQVPSMQITAKGLHAMIHKVTLITATLAMRISAETACWSALLLREVTFIFLACWRNSSSWWNTARTMKQQQQTMIVTGITKRQVNEAKIWVLLFIVVVKPSNEHLWGLNLTCYCAVYLFKESLS